MNREPEISKLKKRISTLEAERDDAERRANEANVFVKHLEAESREKDRMSHNEKLAYELRIEAYEMKLDERESIISYFKNENTRLKQEREREYRELDTDRRILEKEYTDLIEKQYSYIQLLEEKANQRSTG